jgi:hypothetical protein
MEISTAELVNLCETDRRGNYRASTTSTGLLIQARRSLVYRVTACGTWGLMERLRCARRERANAAAA